MTTEEQIAPEIMRLRVLVLELRLALEAKRLKLIRDGRGGSTCCLGEAASLLRAAESALESAESFARRDEPLANMLPRNFSNRLDI
jgi:hypothetical protein